MKRANILTLSVLILFSLPVFTSCKKKEKTQDVPLTSLSHGTFLLDMYEEGEIEAINSINLSSPVISWRYGNLKITKMTKDGTEVKSGDTLIVFDPSEVQKGVIDAEARVQMNLADLEKMKAQQQSEIDELKSNYEITKISYEISKIRFESAGYEAEIRKREIKLGLDKANIALERAKEEINNKIKIQKEEIKQKQLSIAQDQAQVNEAKETFKKLFVVTPAQGIAIIRTNWSSGNKFQVGDQCWSGMPIIQLPDLNLLRANVKINEVDIAKIAVGQKVEIKPDAFSESKYTGAVTDIANLASEKDGKSKIKVFPVQIKINESDKKLLPGLTVSCRIILGKIENADYLPLEAVHSEGDKYFVYVKKGNGYEKIFVETGASNSDHIIVTKGLKKTDKVTLADPFVKEDKDKKEDTPQKV